MASGDPRWPGLPYLRQPGQCPRCGLQVRPAASEVHAGGIWSTRGEGGGIVTGGHLFWYRCPGCGTDLLSFPQGWPEWEEVDPVELLWFPAEPG